MLARVGALSGLSARMSIFARALSAIRRLGGTALYVPDDYGLVLGPELVSNGDFSNGATGWSLTQPTSGSVSVVSGAMRVYSADGTLAVFAQNGYPVSKTVRVTFDVTVVSGACTVQSGVGLNYTTASASGRYSSVVTTDSSGTLQVKRSTGVATDFTIDNISVREILSATSFIDSTGTQPVTAVGDLVGLLTDRSYGASNLGAEASPDVEFVTPASWELVQPTSGSTTMSGGQLRINSADGSIASCLTTGAVLTVGAMYQVTMDVAAYTGTVVVNNSATVPIPAGTGVKVFYFVADLNKIVIKRGGVCDITINSASFKRVLGNHATQPTTASKPLVTRVPKRLGPNLVSNGGFDSGTGWTFSGGSIASGVATWSGASADLQQPITVTVGRDYVITFSVTAYTAGSGVGIHNGVGPFIRGSLTRRTTVGTYTETLTATQTGSLTLNGAFLAAQGASIDNITVQEVLELTPALDFDGSNDLLTLSSGAILQQGTDHFVTAAFVLDAVGANQAVFGGATAPGVANPVVCSFGFNTTSGGRFLAFWRDDAGGARTLVGTSTPVVGVPYVVTAARVGATSYLWVNGVLEASGAAVTGTTTVTAATIGATSRSAVIEYLNGKLIDLVVDQGTLTEADRKTIERNMAQRAGVAYAG